MAWDFPGRPLGVQLLGPIVVDPDLSLIGVLLAGGSARRGRRKCPMRMPGLAGRPGLSKRSHMQANGS